MTRGMSSLDITSHSLSPWHSLSRLTHLYMYRLWHTKYLFTSLSLSSWNWNNRKALSISLSRVFEHTQIVVSKLRIESNPINLIKSVCASYSSDDASFLTRAVDLRIIVGLNCVRCVQPYMSLGSSSFSFFIYFYNINSLIYSSLCM